MRHGTTVLQTLAGAACAVLLASCGTTEAVTGDVADEPAAQVEVSDREAEDDPADEKNVEPEPAAEGEPVEEAGLDASAPVTDVTSAYGIDVTAPEGFLDTPEYAALEDEIASLADSGHSVSVRMIDVETGRGVSYNAGVARYPASAIKAAYCAAICETYGGSAGWSQTMAQCLINSANDAYTTLIQTFGLSLLTSWLSANDAPGAAAEAPSHYYPDITAEELANVWLEIWRYGTSGEAGADELASYLSQTEYTPMGALLRDECEVWAKPGWYPADENDLTSTNDAGVVFSDDGTYVLVVMTDLSADLDRLTPLIDALDAAHDVMCGG